MFSVSWSAQDVAAVADVADRIEPGLITFRILLHLGYLQLLPTPLGILFARSS